MVFNNMETGTVVFASLFPFGEGFVYWLVSLFR
jgi:hypothetical protein